MNRCILSLALFFFGLSLSLSQTLPEPKLLLEAMSGSFQWEMYDKNDKLLRSGSKKSILVFDGILLRSEEMFEGSQIRMEGMFGYNESKRQFFTISVFNVDPGPHLSYADYSRGMEHLKFVENDSTQTQLRFIDQNKHYWISFKKKENQWNKHLKIVFTRN